MPKAAHSGQTRVLSTSTTWLAWIYAAALVAWAIVYPLLDKVNSQSLGSAMNIAGAVLIAAGLFAFARTSPWVAVALVTLGALVGTLPIFWAVVPSIAMIALIVLIVRDARRTSPVAAAPAG
jgi:hypothetical protein